MSDPRAMPSPARNHALDEAVVQDFDRIAGLPEEAWRSDDGYVADLVRRVPQGTGSALEIGCGTGRVTRQLARRCRRVDATDFSPEMIRRARQLTSGLGHVHFETGDIRKAHYAPGTFDVIVSVSTLHHLPLAESLACMARWLAPGGRLLILDLAWPVGPLKLPRMALAKVVGLTSRLWHQHRLLRPAAERDAWNQHALRDHFHPLGEVRAAAAEHLPGARVEPLLLWRYRLTWSAPESRPAGGRGTT